MEKINIAELLKDCPSGMELDCTMIDSITFEGVDVSPSKYPIAIRNIKTNEVIYLTKYGQFVDKEGYKCVIFPKGKTTWEGFQRPFEDGDIIITHTAEYTWASIFKQFSGNSCCAYVDLCTNDNDLIIALRLCDIEEIKGQRLATEEEKEKLFQVMKDNGYKWNPETKTLDKLPKFKVGDRITNGKTSFIVGYVDDEYYYEISRNIASRLFIKNQDDWELVPNKFDINTLIPFESRVLVRVCDIQIWTPTFWGKYIKNGSNYSYLTTNGCYKYCIPYEGNEHLLGTKDDCDEYFKTWK